MAENPYANQPESINRGGTVYTMHCARCHGVEGLGDGADVAGLTSAPVDLTTYGAEKSANAAAMNITYGKGEMPPYENVLTQQEIWDVSNYVVSLAASEAN